MSTATFERTAASGVVAPYAVPAPKRAGFFKRLYAAMIVARQRQAQAEVRRHVLLVPRELERAGWKINERSEDSLPFVR